jgi:hypothetical protein
MAALRSSSHSASSLENGASSLCKPTQENEREEGNDGKSKRVRCSDYGGSVLLEVAGA